MPVGQGLLFKQIFPEWRTFKQFLVDYSVYYPAEEYTDEKALVYYTLLYRRFANSAAAYDYHVFLEHLSLTVEENFREFFQKRKLLDHVAQMEVKDFLREIESVTNSSEKNNYTTDKDSILPVIGAQVRSYSKGNELDRVYDSIRKLNIPEIRTEVEKYTHLFTQIISRSVWLYTEDEDD